MFAGLLVPWMLVWQFRQPRARVFAPVLVPVRDPTLPRWLVGSWHCWHRNGWRALSRFGVVVPCGLWQIEQSSCTGWCVHERPALFHVAGVAGVVHVVAHHLRSHRPMRIVAVRARDQPFRESGGARDG